MAHGDVLFCTARRICAEQRAGSGFAAAAELRPAVSWQQPTEKQKTKYKLAAGNINCGKLFNISEAKALELRRNLLLFYIRQRRHFDGGRIIHAAIAPAGANKMYLRKVPPLPETVK